MLGFGGQDKKVLKDGGKVADKVLAKVATLAELSDKEIKQRTIELQEVARQDVDLDDIMVDAFATVWIAAERVLGLKAYRVQLIGAYILHLGDVAEMKTGEGKTLTSIFAIFLNALSGKGVHVVTVNEYLAERDFKEMKPVFEFLGLTVGLNVRTKTPTEKKAAYLADVMYTVNSELGFDYLRDNMVIDAEDKVQRALNFAVIDECDSILIDEARTPLIISGGEKGDPNLVQAAAQFVRNLKEGKHFSLNQENKSINLLKAGGDLAEKAFRIPNLYDLKFADLLHAINNSLRAQFIMQKDVDYAVVNGEIVIIDTFTGRLMPGRSFSNGLHQAIQGKEKAKIKLESYVVATITYQNYFRMYFKLGGMTGTAKTEEEEFVEIFNMRVIEVPTNKPVIRKDMKNKYYLTKKAAVDALLKDIKARHETGQPVLVGTISVERSEYVAAAMKKAGLKFELLNAKNNTREADIIKNAGQKNSITISTNMAGRGTDIKLGEGVFELGGLAVLGVEKNDSRRIDNQLSGRSGRQGDPGVSQFYISLQDELIMRFNTKHIERAIKMSGGEMQSKLITSTVTGAQKRIEGMNYDMRKNLIKYDDVMRQQRDLMYAQRDKFLLTKNFANIVDAFINSAAKDIVKHCSYKIEKEEKVDGNKIAAVVNGKMLAADTLLPSDFENRSVKDSIKLLSAALIAQYQDRVEEFPKDVVNNIERRIILQSFDKWWREHIDKLTKLRSGVSLQSYKQQDPLQVYIQESEKLFIETKERITNEIVAMLMTLKIQKKVTPKAPVKKDVKTKDKIVVTQKELKAAKKPAAKKAPAKKPAAKKPAAKKAPAKKPATKK